MSNPTQILVRLPEKRRVQAQVGTHLVMTDQPIENGGEGSAPSPFDLFISSIGACAGIFVQGFCAQRQIPYGDIQIVETLQYGSDGVLSGVELDVRLPPDFPEKYRGAVQKVVEQCSVKRAILAQPTFQVKTSRVTQIGSERAPDGDLNRKGNTVSG